MQLTKYEQFLQHSVEHGERSQITIDYLVKHMKDIIEECRNYKPKKVYKYMLTFTVKPGCKQSSEWIEKYIIKLMLKDQTLTTVYYVKEHADTNVHWHVIIKTQVPYKYAKLDYYKRTIGRVDVDPSQVKHDEFSSKYLEKEGQLVILKGELEKKLIV